MSQISKKLCRTVQEAADAKPGPRQAALARPEAEQRPGRIFISNEEQQRYMDVQRARYLQGEQIGISPQLIMGQKPPIKINLGKYFLKKDGQNFIKDLQREFISSAAKKSKEEIEEKAKKVKEEI